MLELLSKIILKPLGWLGSHVSWYSLRAFLNHGKFYDLNYHDFNKLRDKLSSGYYIILTKDTNTLSSWLISAATLFVSGHWGHYTHALMNLENEVNADADFRLVEASSQRPDGVGFTTFASAFAVDSVALLRPRGITMEEWVKIFETLLEQKGKRYDSVFDLSTNEAVSCVELVRVALQSLPNYDVRFAAFEKMIQENKNLTPQDYYDCPDFEHVWEVRR